MTADRSSVVSEVDKDFITCPQLRVALASQAVRREMETLSALSGRGSGCWCVVGRLYRVGIDECTSERSGTFYCKDSSGAGWLDFDPRCLRRRSGGVEIRGKGGGGGSVCRELGGGGGFFLACEDFGENVQSFIPRLRFF